MKKGLNDRRHTPQWRGRMDLFQASFRLRLKKVWPSKLLISHSYFLYYFFLHFKDAHVVPNARALVEPSAVRMHDVKNVCEGSFGGGRASHG
jgi:hypothetical protein